MTHEFQLPDVGEGVAEGEVVQWLVSVGDTVTEDQPIVEIETDKALVEIPSPVDGTIATLHAEEGEMVPVGNVLVSFDVEGEAPTSAGEATEPDAGAAEPADTAGETEANSPGGQPFAPPHVRRLARELDVALADVDGSGPGGRVTEADVHAAADGVPGPDEVPATDTDDADGSAAAVSEVATAGSGASRERTLAAPATRRIARELGVDLDAVPATEEREGEAFVTAEAVRAFAEGGGEPETATTATQPAPGERETTEPYQGLRRTIGDRMVQAKSEIPHVHSFETVDVSRLVEVRERLTPRAEERGISLTYMPFIIKALVAALREYPSLNATLDEEAGEIVRKHYYNVGIAVHTDAGLMVPVVEGAGEKGLLELASAIDELATKARDRSISREEMQGGTITITNFGAVGGEFGTPIINHPEVAIVGVGRIEERPVVVDGEVVARHTLPLSVGVDHRVVDGGTEAAFRNRLKEYLTEPSMLLLEDP